MCLVGSSLCLIGSPYLIHPTYLFGSLHPLASRGTSGMEYDRSGNAGGLRVEDGNNRVAASAAERDKEEKKAEGQEALLDDSNGGGSQNGRSGGGLDFSGLVLGFGDRVAGRAVLEYDDDSDGGDDALMEQENYGLGRRGDVLVSTCSRSPARGGNGWEPPCRGVCT